MSGISIIIPVFKEEKIINDLIFHIKKRFENRDYEIIVSDGEKTGSTIELIEDKNIVKLLSKQGRARQMNYAAQFATKEILFFLHSDSFIPKNSYDQIINVLKINRFSAGAFDLQIDTKNPVLQIFSKIACIRSRLTKIPYGDQGIFITKSLFFKLGGYLDLPLMEDIDIMLRLRRNKHKIKIIDKKIKTSPRRWEEQGVVFCSLRNIIISTLFYLGKDPKLLKRYYNISSPSWPNFSKLK